MPFEPLQQQISGSVSHVLSVSHAASIMLQSLTLCWAWLLSFESVLEMIRFIVGYPCCHNFHAMASHRFPRHRYAWLSDRHCGRVCCQYACAHAECLSDAFAHCCTIARKS